MGLGLTLGGCGGGDGDWPPPGLSGVEIELPDGSDLEIPGHMVTFPNDRGETITGVLVVPESDEPLPTMVVLHGGGGLFTSPDSNDTKFEVASQFSEWTALLARKDYAVLLPASFFSRGHFEWNDLRDAEDLDGVDRLTMRVYDAYAALDYVCSRPELDCDRVAALGFSNGASTSGLILHERLDEVQGMNQLTPASERPAFAFSIAYYPGCGFQGLVSTSMDDPDAYYFPTAPLWIQHASEDSLVDNCEMRLEQTEQIAQLRGYPSNPLDLTVYSDAGHGFDSSPSGSSEKEARDTARAITLDLIDSNL